MEHLPEKQTESKPITFTELQTRFIALHFKDLKTVCSNEDMIFLALVCKMEKSFFTNQEGEYASQWNQNKLVNIESGIANLRKIIRKNPGIQPAIVSELLDKISGQIFISTDKSGVYLDTETSELRSPIYEQMLNKCTAVAYLSEEIISKIIPNDSESESDLVIPIENMVRDQEWVRMLWELISQLESLKAKYLTIYNKYKLNSLLHDSGFAETSLINDICGNRTELADWNGVVDSFWKKTGEYTNQNPNGDYEILETIKPLIAELSDTLKVFNT